MANELSRYERGFLTKCAEYGLNGAEAAHVMDYAMQKRAQQLRVGSAKIKNGGGFKIGDLMIGGGTLPGGFTGGGIMSPSGGIGIGAKSNLVGNSALGAGAGALTGLILEKLRGGERKEYLKRMIRTALLGAAAGGIGTMATSAPNYLSKLQGAVVDGLGKAKNAVKKTDTK